MKVEDLKIDEPFVKTLLIRWEDFIKVLQSQGSDLKSGTLFEKVAAFNRLTNLMFQWKHFIQMQGPTIYLGKYHKILDSENDYDVPTLDHHPIFLDSTEKESNNTIGDLEDLLKMLKKHSGCNNE